MIPFLVNWITDTPDGRRRSLLEVIVIAACIAVGVLVFHGQALHIWILATGAITVVTIETLAYRQRERRRRRWDRRLAKSRNSTGG
jgi:Flp pilus assembly protein TadB